MDEKLESYISKIKNTNSTHNKLHNYKRASNRLTELKTEYNNLCAAIKEEVSPIESEPVNIDKVITELKKLSDDLETEQPDMKVLIAKYVQYKLLLSVFDTEVEQIKNEIHKVDMNKKNKITIHKLSLEEFI